jgi:hypothetical protein
MPALKAPAYFQSASPDFRQGFVGQAEARAAIERSRPDFVKATSFNGRPTRLNVSGMPSA